MDGPVVAAGLDDLRHQVRRQVPRVVLVLVEHPAQQRRLDVKHGGHDVQPDAAAIYRGGQHLPERSELLGQARLELQLELADGVQRKPTETNVSGTFRTGLKKTGMLTPAPRSEEHTSELQSRF